MSMRGGDGLKGKVALVTGGSSGIGRAIAERFLSEGASVAIVGNQNLEKARAVAREIGTAQAACEGFVVDVKSAKAVASLVADVGQRMGPVDILVNSAGVWYPTPIGSLTPEQIDDMIDVNLKGVIHTVSAVVPGMIARRSGRIVNIASIAALVPTAGYSLYSTTKAAVVAFTKSAGLELAQFNVAMNAIAPGNTATPMNAAIRTASEHQGRRDWIQSITPSARAFTPPEEIAETALFLSDGRVRGIFGAVISVDEGRAAGIAMKEE